MVKSTKGGVDRLTQLRHASGTNFDTSQYGSVTPIDVDEDEQMVQVQDLAEAIKDAHKQVSSVTSLIVEHADVLANTSSFTKEKEVTRQLEQLQSKGNILIGKIKKFIDELKGVVANPDTPKRAKFLGNQTITSTCDTFRNLLNKFLAAQEKYREVYRTHIRALVPIVYHHIHIFIT